MRLARLFVIASLCAPVLFAACGSNAEPPDNDPFATYQDCFNDHHMDEGFDAQKSIVICCIDHPIGSNAMNVVCGDNAGDCEAYVGQNLSSPDVAPSDITAACMDYITQRGM